MASDWHAGHMAHAAVTIKRVARYLTALVEVVDARAPELTRYPGIQQWIGPCPILLVLNREDLADEATTAAWIRTYQARGQRAVAVTARDRRSVRRVAEALQQMERPGRGRRAAVLGLPNLGKSTLLNQLLGRHRLKTANRPGVTRGPQWVRQDGWEWLDLPGVMTGLQRRDWRLGVLGAAAIAPGDYLEAAERLLPLARAVDCPATLEAWATRHGMLRPGAVPDLDRAATAVVRVFQEGGLGRISLEHPDDVRDE